MEKLDILAFGAHPDDVEIGAGGMLIAEAKRGKRVGIIDLTLGEMGTRGNVETRLSEAGRAADIMGCCMRDNLRLPDGKLLNTVQYREAVMDLIRKYKPDVVIANAPSDRHPDHGQAAQLVKDAWFLAGLIKYTSDYAPWRPQSIFHYMQFYHLKPDFIYDISHTYMHKMEAVKAHASQFYNPDSNEPETLISSEAFLESIGHRAAEFGLQCGFKYGEAFLANRCVGISHLDHVK